MKHSSKSAQYFSQQQLSYPQYIPFNFEYADLEIIMEPEPSSDSPSSSENKWIYLTCALISLALMGLSWFANCSQMEQAGSKN